MRKLRGLGASKNFILIFMFLLIFGGFVFADVNFPSKVNVQGLNILYDKFDGSTTDFNSLNESELKNLEDMILEISVYGKIEFNEVMDIPSMAGSDWTVDFDSNVNISDNLIYVNNYNLPNIDREVTLYLRNLEMEEPEIWNNDGVCSDCELISYSGGDLVFSVSNFSGAYFAKETYVPPVCGDGVCEGDENEENCPEDCADEGDDSGDDSGGGGGGETDEDPEEQPAGKYDFKIFPPTLETEIKKGYYVQKEIRVENNGSMPLRIGVGVEGVQEFIFPEVSSFSIEPGEVREIRFDIYVSDKRAADVYFGKIHFISRYVTRDADVIMNVKERDALFDIRTTVLKKYVNPGSRVRANISLINMGDLRNFDVDLEYKIVDFDENVYTIKKEQFAINRSYSGVFFLEVPENISMGNYVFYSVVRYQDVNATSYDTFVVEKVSYYSWILLIFLILLLMYFAYRWYRKRTYEMQANEVERRKERDKKEKKSPQLKKIREHVEQEKSVDELLPELP